MSTFVIEIGTEELPARFLSSLEKELYIRFNSMLIDSNIEYKELKVYTTPRRAIVIASEVNPIQKEKEEVISGPPARVAFDSNGNPSKAMESFARTHDVNISELFKIETDKGEYVAVRKKMGGRKVIEILQEKSSKLICELPFPKRMRWDAKTPAYARPIRWILAIFDAEPIKFSIGAIKSGIITFGHRIHGAGPFKINNANDYLDIIKNKGHVCISAEKRLATITEQGNAEAKKVDGQVLWNKSLLDEVKGLCEYPQVILGDFNPSFLEIPREVLLTSMEIHQKSFGLQDESGHLLPHFITVLNLDPKDKSLVKKGWERVLRARLEDARFFWNTDLNENFDTWLKKLDNVIFLGPLGSMGEKSQRIAKLCQYLNAKCNICSAEDAAKAGHLSKADLVTGMVGEFDTLQGIMGGIYAKQMGENEIVSAAIAEQYLPAGAESPIAKTKLGALLSISDKTDTLIGCFGLEIIPTGTADPNALRRCALGIIRTIIGHNLRININSLFMEAQKNYTKAKWVLEPEESLQKLYSFFGLRLKNFLVSQGSETLLVEAVLKAGYDDVWTAQKRLKALEQFSKHDDYIKSIQTFKRMTNIINKHNKNTEIVSTKMWSEQLLVDDSEKILAKKLLEILPLFDQLWDNDEYEQILLLIPQIRPYISDFFENTMVMCEDKDLQMNRINLLMSIVTKMNRVADFSALQI